MGGTWEEAGGPLVAGGWGSSQKRGWEEGPWKARGWEDLAVGSGVGEWVRELSD